MKQNLKKLLYLHREKSFSHTFYDNANASIRCISAGISL